MEIRVDSKVSFEDLFDTLEDERILLDFMRYVVQRLYTRDQELEFMDITREMQGSLVIAAKKDLYFAGQHLQPVMDGEKCITLRKYDRDKHLFAKGEIVKGVFLTEPVPTEVHLFISEDTEILPLCQIPDEVCQEDGFTDNEHCERGMKEYYKDLTHQTPMGIIRFVSILGKNL